MNTYSDFIVSLGAMRAWLPPHAEARGVKLYPGFAAAETLHEPTADGSSGTVIGVRIADRGVARDSCTSLGTCPVSTSTQESSEIAPGLCQRTGLPRSALQAMGSLPAVEEPTADFTFAAAAPYFWRARATATGGGQSLPQLEMPGALLIGDTAGLLNAPKIKCIHQAIRSGMPAAEHLAQAVDPAGFDARLRGPDAMPELSEVRSIKPGFKKGLWLGILNACWETNTRDLWPCTLKVKPEWCSLDKIGVHELHKRNYVQRALTQATASTRPPPSTMKISPFTSKSPTLQFASPAA